MKLTKARLQQIIKEEVEASEVDEGVLDKIKGFFKKDGGGLPFFSIDQKSIMALINNDFPELKGNDPDAFKMQKMFNADPEGVQKKLALKYLNIITGMPTSNTSFDKAFAKYQKDTARRDGKTGVGKNLRDEIGRDRDKGELAKGLYSIIYSAYGKSPAYKEFQKNTKRYHGYLAAKDAAKLDRYYADSAKARAEFEKGQPSRPPGYRPIPRQRGNPFDLGEGQEMKLTKARLQQIIKEEIEGTQASAEYQVSHPYHGKPHRYSPDETWYKQAVRVLEKVKETYPNLVGQLTEDHLIQNLANDANSTSYGGGRFGYSDAIKVLLEMLEKAHSS